MDGSSLHVYTELMRGCRGWQVAHGPGDASMLRGLHGELEFMRPIVASADPGPPVHVEPWLEHWSRRHGGKTYVIAATTRGIAFGHCRAGDDAGWFLRTFYRQDLKGLPAALQYVPATAAHIGPPPSPNVRARLEVPLDAIGADGKLVDGVGFMHPAGRVLWGRTSIVAPGGDELEVWGDAIALPPDQLATTKISVGGLRAGSRVRVLFEDRALTAPDGYFVDDFRGRNLYQRFGGGADAGVWRRAGGASCLRDQMTVVSFLVDVRRTQVQPVSLQTRRSVLTDGLAGIELSVVDHQFTVKQMRLFDSGVTTGRIPPSPRPA